jgi:hypothetical protein
MYNVHDESELTLVISTFRIVNKVSLIIIYLYINSSDVISENEFAMQMQLWDKFLSILFLIKLWSYRCSHVYSFRAVVLKVWSMGFWEPVSPLQGGLWDKNNSYNNYYPLSSPLIVASMTQKQQWTKTAGALA